MKELPEHKYCVNMIEVLQSDSYVFIVVELVKGGQLFDIVNNHPDKKLPAEKARTYFKQIIEGLEFLHKEKIVHRDLKLENILVHEDGHIMISDFGLSGSRKQIANNRELKDVAGSPNYVAPEIISGRGYDGYAADIWSCGVILYALLAGFLPFDDDDFGKLFEQIVACEICFPKWFPWPAVHLMAKIFVVDPLQRIKIDKIKAHPFYTGIDDISPASGSNTPSQRRSQVRFSLSAVADDDDVPASTPVLDAMKSMQYYVDEEAEEEVLALSSTPAMSAPPPVDLVQSNYTNYEGDVSEESPQAKDKSGLTFFDLMGHKFQKMVTNVLRRDQTKDPDGEEEQDLSEEVERMKLKQTVSLPKKKRQILEDSDEEFPESRSRAKSAPSRPRVVR